MSEQSGILEQGSGVLTAAAKAIEQAQEDLAGQAARLRAQVEPMAAQWQGAGGGAFFQFHQAWQAKEQRIIEILTSFADAIGATHTTTEQVDAEESAGYRKTMDRLG
jgi:WXG100 family type VII secretion target